MSESQDGFNLSHGAPAGWYPLPGGGQRYWDGHQWLGDPVPSKKRAQEPSNPALVSLAIGGSLLLTPLVGIVMGLFRMRKNRRDAWKMIGWGIAAWILGVIIWTLVFNH